MSTTNHNSLYYGALSCFSILTNPGEPRLFITYIGISRYEYVILISVYVCSYLNFHVFGELILLFQIYFITFLYLYLLQQTSLILSCKISCLNTEIATILLVTAFVGSLQKNIVLMKKCMKIYVDISLAVFFYSKVLQYADDT